MTRIRELAFITAVAASLVREPNFLKRKETMPDTMPQVGVQDLELITNLSSMRVRMGHDLGCEMGGLFQ
jgi:hypothetical protein